jgi:hypothetical protein
MKDFLQDLVAHTHALGVIPLVKITSANNTTTIEGRAEDRSVIMTAVAKTPITNFTGVFGMPNLNKLDIHLKCPEYKTNAIINVVTVERNGEAIPTELHFKNAAGNFENHYRFMSTETINEKLKPINFKGANYLIEFTPSMAAVQKLKFQSQAHSEEPNVQVKTDGTDLIFSFGDASTHAGSFVFESEVAALANVWTWPISQLLAILSLPGDITMRISDQGAMELKVDSGAVEYTYILPALSK